MNPPVFVSATSGDLGAARDLVVSVLSGMGYQTRVQPAFPFVGGDLRVELRRLIDECGLVVQLVGFRCGQVPATDDPDFGRVSHTQFEARYAEQQKKRVLYITLPDTFPFTTCEPESEEYVALQRDYRQGLRARGDQRRTPATPDALKALIYQMRDDLSELLKLAAARHEELRGDLRGLKQVFEDLRSDLAGRGLKPADLPVEELEHELARRVPNLTREDLHRLIGYALFKADISRIVKYAPVELIGRDDELEVLNSAWDKVRRAESPRPHVLTFVALGGEGKTSLVAKWAAELAHQDWPGCDAAFAWSFYSQGTREQTAVSSDLFLAEALAFFGDPAMAASAQGAFDKGRRLAQLVGERRALLVLDGLEPLQYAPSSPTPGELKDQGVAALLKGLAASNHGLCVVTTRYRIPDLRAYWQTTAPMHELPRLSAAAGVKLLRTIGVKTGSQVDFEKLVEDVDGHALTLQILGQFLVRAFHGDIRRRDRISFEKADEKIQGGHAFRAMDAYVKWLEDDSEEARREVALLKLLGLFDRPATADCVAALRKAPAITGLTDPLVGLAEEDWEFSLTSLRDAKLLTVNRDDGSGELVAVDAHPLLREYFARRVRQLQPEAWRAAHRRLYKHLCETTTEGEQPTLEDLQPLYQAVAHGCQAGLQQEACRVFFARLRRENENYVNLKLGAYGSELGAVSCFFHPPWDRVSPALTEADQAWLLAVAAFDLRALGRLTEALEPMRTALEMGIKQQNWKSAAVRASNLSELELTLGEVTGAMRDADQSVNYADRTGDANERWSNRCTHAASMHQAGRRAEAEARFREAEEIQAERQPSFPLLYGLACFRYCDLLLTEAERAAWQRTLRSGMSESLQQSNDQGAPHDLDRANGVSAALQSCRAVFKRAAQTLQWVTPQDWLLDIALDHLTLGRAALYASILGGAELLLGPNIGDTQQRVRADNELSNARRELDAAVAGLSPAGRQDHLPRGLLTRAWCSFAEASQHTRLERKSEATQFLARAQSDLDEAWEIAERGPMPLFLADIHLHRARLFGRPKTDASDATYPWESPAADLAAARRLIEKHGYLRRMEELEDAEAVIVGKPQSL